MVGLWFIANTVGSHVKRKSEVLQTNLKLDEYKPFHSACDVSDTCLRVLNIFSIHGCRASTDGSLVVWVNVDDHLKLVSTRDDANIAEALKCICVNLQKVGDLGLTRV